MKILKFLAENVKGIKVVELSPNGESVVLSGANGAGKSSVLDAIFLTLCGGDLPLRNGAEKGGTEIDLGDYTVIRKRTEKTDRLIIKNKEGAIFPEPRAMLQKLVGKLTIDPLAFVKLKPRDQLDVLFQLIPGLEKGLNNIEKRIEEIKTKRSNILAMGNRAKVELENMPTLTDIPANEIDVSALTEKLNETIRNNKILDEKRQQKNELTLNAIEMAHDLSETEKEIEALEQKKKSLSVGVVNINACIKELGDIPENESIESITAEIAGAEEINKKYRQVIDRQKKAKEKDELGTQYSKLGDEMKKVEAEKSALLSTAKMPIAGLSVAGQDVIYNGVSVSQLSTSEKVRVGAAIAVAQKPKAEIILADDVSLLDKKSLAILHDICKDFQIWQVVNDDSGNVGIYIEDGTVKKA
jgi:DNA repair exonuclease SbcCD ATPase subunit